MKNFLTRSRFIAFSFLLLVLYGCASRGIITTWKTQDISPPDHRRVLVVAILPDEDSADRKIIETNFTTSLNDLGYNAVSAVSEYGINGLANLGEENTYTKLNNRGIDAVLIVALVNRTKETGSRFARVYTYPNAYYYQRIWNYKNALVLPGTDDNLFYWEGILFNLNKLEVDCAVRTIPSPKTSLLKGDDLVKKITQKMMREKILKQKKKGF